MYEYVKSIISQITHCEIVLERPKNREFGHFATPVAFTLAKARKQSPEGDRKRAMRTARRA